MISFCFRILHRNFTMTFYILVSTLSRNMHVSLWDLLFINETTQLGKLLDVLGLSDLHAYICFYQLFCERDIFKHVIIKFLSFVIILERVCFMDPFLKVRRVPTVALTTDVDQQVGPIPYKKWMCEVMHAILVLLLPKVVHIELPNKWSKTTVFIVLS